MNNSNLHVFYNKLSLINHYKLYGTLPKNHDNLISNVNTKFSQTDSQNDQNFIEIPCTIADQRL